MSIWRFIQSFTGHSNFLEYIFLFLGLMYDNKVWLQAFGLGMNEEWKAFRGAMYTCLLVALLFATRTSMCSRIQTRLNNECFEWIMDFFAVLLDRLIDLSNISIKWIYFIFCLTIWYKIIYFIINFIANKYPAFAPLIALTVLTCYRNNKVSWGFLDCKKINIIKYIQTIYLW